HIHPEAALLPWYLNGTLGDAESRQVAGHLQSCAACRSELDELSMGDCHYDGIVRAAARRRQTGEPRPGNLETR
ncbi:MAG: hypothetical protein HC869_21895, partial [Rhodospirillales bacterium]|nr:hypothetical protein [Rhodospirillales bacterium]